MVDSKRKTQSKELHKKFKCFLFFFLYIYMLVFFLQVSKPSAPEVHKEEDSQGRSNDQDYHTA